MSHRPVPCLSFAPTDTLLAALRENRAEWVESRFDLASENAVPVAEVAEITKIAPNRIATCRINRDFPPIRALAILREAVAEGFNYVDIDHDEERHFPPDFFRHLREKGVGCIRSCHYPKADFSLTQVEREIDRLWQSELFLLKLVVPVCQPQEAERLMTLYGRKPNLLLLASGDAGRESRIAATRYGAPFSYVYLEKPTGEGQLSLHDYLQEFAQRYG